MYLPTLPTLNNATQDDLLNEASVYLEMLRNTLTMVHDSLPLESHLPPILLSLDCLAHNTNELIQLALTQSSKGANHD